MGERGKRLLAVHSDRALHATRLVVERRHAGETQVFLCGDDASGWTLPGGWVGQDRNRALEAGLDGAWDVGNLIGALGDLCRKQLGMTFCWMSYVGDYDEENHLCRVYATTLAHESDDPVLPEDARWFSSSALSNTQLSCAFGRDVIDLWLDEDSGFVRGKGKSEQQCLPVDGLNQYID